MLRWEGVGEEMVVFVWSCKRKKYAEIGLAVCRYGKVVCG